MNNNGSIVFMEIKLIVKKTAYKTDNAS